MMTSKGRKIVIQAKPKNTLEEMINHSQTKGCINSQSNRRLTKKCKYNPRKINDKMHVENGDEGF